MKCAWKELLAILPPQLARQAAEQGRDGLQELRLRLGQAPELVIDGRSCWGTGRIEEKDLNFVVNVASRYSPWAAQTIAQGYLTAPGGHRIGLCGEAVVENEHLRGIRNVKSLCIRVARDFPGSGAKTPQSGSVLILGPPGSGKTTLLRDVIRQRSDRGPGSVAVVDERGELFPPGCFDTGKRTDILTGCSKVQGIDMALRTMGPAVIAVDEITAEEDCQALIRGSCCGVELLATAHAGSKGDLLNRPVYRELARSRIFEKILILQRDKSWKMERME